MSAAGTLPNSVEEFVEASTRLAGGSSSLLSAALRVAFSVLADRCLLWASLLGSFALFGYSVYEPSVIREVIATTYTLLVLTPQIVLRKREK